LSSEFEEEIEKKQIDVFIKNSSNNALEKHFITQEMVALYEQDSIDDFSSKREDYLRLKECHFVEELKIKYTE
jgi:hypothetical protein